jgi:MFS family permease
MMVLLLRTLFGSDAAIIRDRGFQILLLVNLSPPLGAALISPLLDSLTSQYGVTEAEIGLMMTAFTSPSIILIPLIGLLADRYGRKIIMLSGLLLFGTSGTALAFTTDFSIVLALRFAQGIGFGGLTPVIVASIGDLYEAGAEATAQGIRFATSGLTLMLFPLLGGLLVTVAWNVPFILYALPFPIAILLYLYFEEPSTTDKEGSASTNMRDLASHVRRPQVATLLIGRSIPNFAYISFLTCNSFIIVRGIGGTPGQAGALVAVTSIAHMIAATQAGRVTARFETRVYPLIGAAIALGGGLALLGTAPNLGIGLIAGAAVGLGFGISLSLYRSIMTGLAPPALRGGVVSMGSSLGRVSSTIAPVILGAAVSIGQPPLGFVSAVRWAVITAGIACLVGGIVAPIIARRSPSVEEDSAATGAGV